MKSLSRQELLLRAVFRAHRRACWTLNLIASSRVTATDKEPMQR